MALPIQVQQQADEAEALAKQLAGEPSEEPQAGQPEGSDKQGGTQTGVEQHPKSDDFEQKYRTLQGIFASEQSKHKQEMDAQGAQIAQLKAELEQMKSQQQAAPVKFGTDEDRAAFGDDFVQLVERGVESRTQEYRKEIASLKAQLEQMGGQVKTMNQSVEVSRHAAFLADLDTMVPGWRTQNADQGFLDWLSQVDPVSGYVRNDILQGASAAHDSVRVAEIFKAYRGTTGQTKARKPTLAQQVSPSKGHSTAPQGKRTFTQAEIGQFYDYWRRGMYTEAQGKAIEQEIEQAIAEGRVI